MATLFELAAHIQSVGGAEALLMMVVKATLILLIARLMLAAMPRASAASRHAIATAALIGVAAMPVLTFFAPAWTLGVPRNLGTSVPRVEARTQEQPRIRGTEEPRNQVGVTGEDEATPSTIGTAITLARATGVVPDEPLSAASRAINVAKSTWKGWFVIAVQFVAMLMLAQMVVGIFGVWFVARKAEEVTHDDALRALDDARDQLALGREVHLLRSSRISVPVLWGFFRPVLLLPADVVTWPEDRLRVVLLHELAHLKRFDGISLILTRIAACLFWYHPLVWSLERSGRNECERSCDDLVLASGTKPSVYADHLLAIARSMPSFDPFRSVTLAMSRKTQLEGRLLSILQPHVVRRALSGRGIVIACIIALALIAPLSALRLTAAPPEQDAVKTDASVTVKPDIEAIEDYVVAKLGKYDKRIDKLARDPKNGKEWWERAYTFYHADRFEEAAAAFRRSAEEGHKEATSLYNAACSHALMGDVDPAILALQQAIDAGWDDFEKIAEDSDFDPIRTDPRFARAIKDSTGKIVNKRLEKTMRRYEDLKSGKVHPDVADAIDEGIRQGVGTSIAAAVAGAVSDAVSQAVTEAVVSGKVNPDPDYDFDFDFDFDVDHDTDWFDVGLDLLRLRQLDQAINAFEHSIKNSEKPSTSMYNIACAYSLKGDVSQGMQWLERAINEGFSNLDKLKNDPDIALLRQQSGFERLRRLAEELEMRTWKDGDDNWGESVDFHRKVVAKYPTSGRAWFNLGFTALQAREYDTGIDAFKRAVSLGHRVGTSSFNVACGYSLKGDRDAAFQWLQKAREAGFELRGHLRNDDDLDNLHDDPRWSALLTEVGAKPSKHKTK